MKNDRALAYGAFAVVCIVWGTTYLAIRIAVETMTPMLLTGARFTAAGVILFIIALLRGESIPRDRRLLRDVVIVGILLVCIGNLAVVWAEQWVPSGIAALLVATAPFWAAILESMRKGGDRIGLRGGAGMLIGFLGVALLVTPRGAGGAFDRHFVLGALAIQIGCFCWQLGTMRSKYRLGGITPLMSSGLQMLSGGVIVGAVGFASGEAHRFTATPRTLGALLYLTLFGSVLAYTAFVYAVTAIRTTSLSLYAYINPVVAVILGWAILREPLSTTAIVAMVVILVGLALSQSGRGKKRGTASEALPLSSSTFSPPQRGEGAEGG